nr:retrovirus-related Pol polyprotein from transposon TNT 1-94 [Tanacetum cinerariifolium]
MALAEDNEAVSKEGARNGEWDTPTPVVVTDFSPTNYDSVDESLVYSTPLPLLKKLDSAEPLYGLKTIKSILRSYNHDTRGHIKIISLRREIKPDNPQRVMKSYETCGSTFHTIIDHNDIEWFRRGETLQDKNAKALKSTKAELSNANRSKTPTKSGCSRHTNGVKSYLHKYVEQPGPKDFQDSPDDEEDTRSSHDYLNDLEKEYQARALLAKSKRFFKKGTQRFSNAKSTDQTEYHKCGKKGHFARDCWSKTSTKYNKFKAKLALLSSSSSAFKASMVKNKGLITEAYEWDEEEVSSDDNDMVEVKVLMALAEENDAVNKEGARNSEWIKISMRKCDIRKPIWYLDSGCSRHMTGVKSYLHKYMEQPGPKFDEKRGTIFNSNKEVIMIAQRVRDVYVLDMTSSAQESCFFAKTSENLDWLWHKRLAHLKFKTINKLAKQNLVIGLPSLVYLKHKPCSACEKGKHHKASFKTKHISSIKKCLYLLHMDLFGPVTPRSINHKGYTLIIVDQYSRYIWDKHIELVNIIGDLRAGMLTRAMARELSATSAHACLFVDFLFEEKPKKVSEVLQHPRWVDAMQEELNQFARNKVWTLVPAPYGCDASADSIAKADPGIFAPNNSIPS